MQAKIVLISIAGKWREILTKVSVIIPVYNVEKYLRECLDSVVNQTLNDIEIICINDGSTDGSLEILKEYAQKDNRVIVIDKENEGVSIARNLGIKMSNSNYVLFLDSDDYLDINCLEKVYSKIQETSVNILNFGLIENWGKCTNPVWYNRELEKNEGIITSPEIIKMFLTNACGKLFNKKYLIDNEITFPENIKTCEDGIFCIKCFLNSTSWYLMNEAFYYYRKNREDSATNSKKEVMKNDILAFKYTLNLPLFINANRAQKKIILEKHLGGILNYYKNENSLILLIEYTYEISLFKKYLFSNFDKELLLECHNINSFIKASSYINLIMNRIFYIRNSREKSHKIINILGIRLKFRRKEYA